MTEIKMSLGQPAQGYELGDLFPFQRGADRGATRTGTCPKALS